MMWAALAKVSSRVLMAVRLGARKMATETKPLTMEDVNRLVEERLQKERESARKKRLDGAQIEDADLTRLEKQAELIGESVGKAVESAIMRCVEKYKTKEPERKGDGKHLFGF